MKILSIGNSFSQDAHRWLHQLAKLNGHDFYTIDLYVSGCSLQTHWEDYLAGNAASSLEINGNLGDTFVTVADALKMEDWDIVTLQQASPLSGKWESYEPYLSNLAQVVKTACPNAQIYFHQTWAYEKDATYSGYKHYDNDQQKMYNGILDASEKAGKKLGAPLIPVGRIIQGLRENLPEFDYGNGGRSLNRDGFHLTYDYGRFAAAATWIKKITGKDVFAKEFEGFDPAILEKICNFVNKEVK